MAEQNTAATRGMIGWMACNPIAANLLMLVVFAAGLASLADIRKEVFPSFPSETFTVTVPYPGSSPEEVENGIIIKVEEALRDIVGVKEINSVSGEGYGQVTVIMKAGTDLEKALSQAKVRIDGIHSFPVDAEEPVVEEVISRGAAMRISLYGELDERRLKEYADQVRDEILALDGISEVNLLGVRDYEISIEISDVQLRRYGLDINQVVEAVQGQSRDLPGGKMRTIEGTITLRSVSQAYNGEDFAAIALLTRADGTRIRLGDIATIRDSFEEQPVLSTLNNQPAVTLIIDRVGEQNVLQITEQLNRYVEQKRLTLPPGLSIEGWMDWSKVLQGRIQLLLKNAGQGALLVILALALFLDLGLAFWVIIGVPFAILGTLATITILGLNVSINVLSVFAFILVLGILVDDGIVTAESAYARLEQENRGVNSIVWGVGRVATATIFGALTTMIAFTPTLFLTEGFARVMTQMGPVVILCLVFSLIETKLILPAHLRHIKVGRRNYKGVRSVIDRFQRAFASGIVRFSNGPYRRLLQLAVRRRYTTLSVFLSALIICLALVPSGIVRFVFFPNVASDMILVTFDMPQGTPWQKTHQLAQRIEQAAWSMDDRYKAQSPDGSGAIEQLLVVSEKDTRASIDIALTPSQHRSISSVELAQWFREFLGPVDGVRSIRINANAGPSNQPILIELTGKNLDSMQQAALDLKQALSEITGVRDISDSLDGGGSELDIHVTPEGEALGLGDVELARQVRQSFFGAEVQRVQRGRHEVRVYVRLPESDRSLRSSLQSLWIRLPDGRKVPFSVVGEVQARHGVSVINRIDRQRVVTVAADINKNLVEPGEVLGELEQGPLQDIFKRYPGVNYQYGGEAEAERTTSTALWFGLAAVLLMIFGALAIPLKSYSSPLLIMSVIPFGVIGAIIGHLLLGKDISVLSIIGIIGLIGVVVNDSLVMVDFINHYIDQGKRWQDAVMDAGPARFRAVVLTSLTTFLGLLPIQLESSIQAQFVKPMAISVAFGVLFATVVTLFLVPTFYFIAKDIQRLLKGEKKGDCDPVALS